MLQWAAKLAVGYLLDELKNDITRETPARFEPSIDYVVTKIPRFAFEKFPQADPKLTTQMNGERMRRACCIRRGSRKPQAGRPRSPVRSLETWWPCARTRRGLGGDVKPWRIGTEVYGDRDILARRLWGSGLHQGMAGW